MSISESCKLKNGRLSSKGQATRSSETSFATLVETTLGFVSAVDKFLANRGTRSP